MVDVFAQVVHVHACAHVHAHYFDLPATNKEMAPGEAGGIRNACYMHVHVLIRRSGSGSHTWQSRVNMTAEQTEHVPLVALRPDTRRFLSRSVCKWWRFTPNIR